MLKILNKFKKSFTAKLKEKDNVLLVEFKDKMLPLHLFQEALYETNYTGKIVFDLRVAKGKESETRYVTAQSVVGILDFYSFEHKPNLELTVA